VRSLKSLCLIITLTFGAAACGGSTDQASPDADPTSTVQASEEDSPATTEASEPAAFDGAETAPVVVSGAALGSVEGGGIVDSPELDPSIGTVAPTLTGTNFQGEEVSIGPDGRPKAVYFLAHWCPHCQDEVELLKELITAGELPDGIDIYGVTIAVREDADNYPPSAWMADFPGAVMRDTLENEAAMAAGVSGIPYVLYLDGENRLLSRSVGSLDKAQILAQWRSLLPQTS